jgi:hypothetical protein
MSASYANFNHVYRYGCCVKLVGFLFNPGLCYKHLYQFSVLHNIVHISLQHVSIFIRPSSGVFYTLILLFYSHASPTLASAYIVGFFVFVNYENG